MKKRLAFILISVCFLTGCGNGNTARNDLSEMENSQYAGEQRTDHDAGNDLNIAPVASEKDNKVTQQTEVIGEAAAKKIALEHAKLTEKEVEFITAKLDQDDGRTEYDVEFYAGQTEYDYEIDAYTGAILKYDTDSVYD